MISVSVMLDKFKLITKWMQCSIRISICIRTLCTPSYGGNRSKEKLDRNVISFYLLLIFIVGTDTDRNYLYQSWQAPNIAIAAFRYLRLHLYTFFI